MAVISLVLGFVLLVVGADKFVEGASALAKKLGIPSLIVGLTVVAFGTSAPELAVSIVAGMRGANEIVVGNVVGSNIFNLLVVVGLSAIIVPLVIEREVLYKEYIYTILAAVFLLLMMFTGQRVSQVEGGILLLLFSITLLMQIRVGLKAKQKEEKEIVAMATWKMLLFIIVGLACIILGGQWVVDGATSIAKMLHISETIIGLTVVAIGTSLPELVTSVVATKKGEKSIAIGNVIGSNLFNIGFIISISAILNPIVVQTTAFIDVIILIICTALLWWPAKKQWIGRKIGVVMLLTYIGYTWYIVVR